MLFNPLPIRSFRLVQKFGSRPDVYAQFGMKGHNGLDLAPLIPGMKNVVVYAPHEGYVRRLEDKNPDGTYRGYGRYVSIESLPLQHDGVARKSYLCHLDRFITEDGDFIAAGDPIGMMGQTGFTTGVHLHWTYKRIRDGVTLDRENGYLGALDIGKYVLPLVLQPLIH